MNFSQKQKKLISNFELYINSFFDNLILTIRITVLFIYISFNQVLYFIIKIQKKNFFDKNNNKI